MKIRVRVKPNSKTEEVNQEGNNFVVMVKAPPEEGKANQAVIKLLAEHLGVPQSQLKILSGFRKRNKTIEVMEK